MKTYLEKFRSDLADSMLGFLWGQWASLGVRASAFSHSNLAVDPEALLLLTLECARWDARFFDEVMDWLTVNHRWINVVRLGALAERDAICSRSVLGAVAAFLAKSDRTPKWRSLAEKSRPVDVGEPREFFQNVLKGPVEFPGAADELWLKYGWKRPAVEAREGSGTVTLDEARFMAPTSFFLRARGLFGVNIRADAFAYLAIQSQGANPTKIARELGYSQRRVYDAVIEMASAGAFISHTDGKSITYKIAPNFLSAFGFAEAPEWFDWRALARSWSGIWRGVFGLREGALTPFVLESELQKILVAVENDVARFQSSAVSVTSDQVSRSGRRLLEVTRIPFAAFDWKRRWICREGENDWPAGLQEQLLKRWAEGDYHSAASGFSFRQIESISCLVLLGEPGMGKTHALGAALAELQLDHDSRPFEALLVDLRECESSEWLRTKVFDSSQFVGWQNGRHDLRLFFDSLDEGRLHLRTLAALLAEKIRSLPSVVGLHLRIACRTADWPQDLEDALREKWGKDDLGVFELAPLDHDDIVSAGDASGLDGRAFYDEIDRRDVSPLAERPVALKFLLKSYLRAGHLPTGQKALYEEGCRLLCEEVSQSRLGARLTGELLPSQRLDVAMQIAAALVLGNRYAVWTGTGTAPQGDISLDELIATDISEERVNWNRSAILETLVDTALFSSRGPQRLGFSHQSYAEFLAAKWLKTGKLNERQISSILWSRVAGQEKLVPQLHQTAAWLAASDESIFAKVKKTDPEVLLSSDVSTATPQGRASLVDTLLEAFESDSIQESVWRLNRRYPKLKHDGLEEQLRKWILDSCKSPRSRRVALKIAQGCEIFKLTSDSLTIALDDEEDYQLRCDAAELVRELGDTPAKRRLKPLLALEQGQDPDSELKAHALMACWPELMSAEELFSVITPPSNTSLGPYHRFLREDLVGKLKPEHLPAALRWFSEHAFWQHLDQRLTNVILDEAVKHLHNEEIREPFGDALFALLGSYDGFVRDEDYSWHVRICDDEALRRVAVGLLAVRIKKIGSSADLFFLFHSKLIQEKDFDWFVEQLEDRKESVTRRVYAHLMLWTYDQKSVSQIESILMAAQRYQEVAQAFADWLTPIDLQSEEAEKLRAQLQERKQREDRSRKSRAERSLSREVDKRIRDLVARVDRTGDVSIWWLLAWDLTLNDSMRYNEHIADLTSLPAWNRADATLRERLISIAQLYVEQSDAAPDKWFAESNIIHRPAYAGFKAMYLLSRERSDVFASLSPSVWKKWVPAILAAPNFSEQEEASIFLTERAYATVPEELTEWIVKEVRREGTAGNSLEVLSKIEKILDSKLDRALLEAAKATDLKVGAFCQLTELLLKRQVAGAQDFCESLLTLPLPIDGARRELIVSIGELLLRYGDGGADAIWLATLQDREFGRALFSKAAYNCYGGAGEVLRKWDEVRLGELFTWLSQEFPREKDERDREAGLLSAREAIATFRDQIISHLADRGSLAGRDVIRHLIDRFPEQEWFRWVLLRAEDNIRRSNWQPPTLEELFGLKRSQNRRFVGSEDELFEIVKESLGRLQEKLQGETELAEFLWNHPRRANARPKEENELNNFVKNFLQDDLVDRGVLANREVEIRKGQMTDVLVQTITRVSRDIRRYAVVIETKGIWNNDIPVSIDKQLAGRYLLNNQTRHGILLVVWFSRDGWDQTDWRYRQGSRAQKDRVLSDLEEDAQHASKEFGVTIEPFVLDASLASQTKSST